MDHEYKGPERIAIATSRMSWESLQPHEIAAAYMAATFTPGNWSIPSCNIAYKPALNLKLISEDGNMHELVFRGLEWAASRLEDGLP